MADTIVVVTEVPVTVEVAGPQGPQGVGVIAGGTTGQVLKKKTGTDYDTEWGTGGGTVTYGTTAGTATEGNDARIANIGSGTINTSADYGSAGIINTSDNGGGNTGGEIDTSASDYNGGKIQTYGGSDAVGGSISTYDGGGSINTRGTGSIGLGIAGTRTTLVGSAATTDKTITLPNATGTVALTQQAADIEITDPTKGYILNSATKRWRLTIDDNGVLLRTALALLFSLSFMCGSQAQVRDLVYGTNNVVIGPTNTNALSFTNSVAFSNPISFGTNAPTVRTNLGLGAARLAPTITNITSPASVTLNSASALEVTVVSVGGWGTTNIITLPTNNPQDGDLVTLIFKRTPSTDPLIVTNTGGLGGPWYVYPGNTANWIYDTSAGPPRWQQLGRTLRAQITYLGDTASETRSLLGVTVASNLPAPYSGAATTNSLLTADGAGGSAFVASRLSVAGLTTNVVRTSWANVGADKPTNDTGLSLTYSAGSVYKLRWSVFVSSTWSNVAYGIAFSSTNSFSMRNGYQVTPQSSTPSGATIATGVTNTTLVSDSTSSYPAPVYVGGEIVFFSTNAGTLNFRFWTTASNTNTSTLLSNSIISLEKIYP